MVEFLKRNDNRACPSVHHGSKSNRWTDWKGKDWFRCNCPWRSARAQLGEGEHCIKDWQWYLTMLPVRRSGARSVTTGGTATRGGR
jgi:hypothetical protein